MAPSDYVELRCRSSFSFLEAASNPEDLALRAAELEYTALALGDRDGVYGIPRFHRAAIAAGVRPLVAAHVTVQARRARSEPQASEVTAQARRARSGLSDSVQRTWTSAPEPTSLSPLPQASEVESAGSLLLLVESPQGYRNLCRLLSLGHARSPKGKSAVFWDEIEEHASGLLALLRGDRSLTPALLDRTGAALGRGQVWVDVSRHLGRNAEAETRRAVALTEAARIPLVASNDVVHARPRERRLLDALTCLRLKTTLDRGGRQLALNAERHLCPPDDMAQRFADRPEWIHATREIAERCGFTLENLGYRFPEFPVPHGETQASTLRRLTFLGARSRYGAPLPHRVRAQLEHELGVIEKLDLAGYFLIVHDIARFAVEQNILSQGRGSAANSAVCYSLGITAVDPIGMELLFERFLSEERGECPDIDIDLPSGDQREKVIQYVFDKYGEHGAAMTSVVISYRTRLAVREMGKVLGMEPDTVDRLAKLISSLEHREELEELTDTLHQAGIDPAAPRIASLLDLVESVRGLPRHLGQHTGGIVIAAGRLDEVVPIEPAAMANRRVVQWDKDDCADLGIIKIDLLGLGMLAALEETLSLVHKHEGTVIDLAHLPADDPTTYAMIRRADTIGVFQIESRAQMATLPRLKPECFYDLVVEVAIIRPGPITGQMVHPYLNRRAGREPVVYPHPSLEPILKRTLGVPLFQEQLLRIAMTAAGFSGGEAEELRRAMGFKRSVERMNEIEERLVEGMCARGISGPAQEEILRSITAFALYGFPESHAASFALIAYASAYLKAHHPAAFLAGILNAYPMGFYGPATLVKDAQRHGVEVRPIDIAHSSWTCTLEGGDGPEGEPAELGDDPAVNLSGGKDRPPISVRLGLRYVAGLRRETGLAVEAERRRRRFHSMADLAKRVALRRDELDRLAELGALASIDTAARTRRSAVWQVAAVERDPRSLFTGVSPPAEASPLNEMTALETTLADYHLSGITTGPHIMQHMRSELRERGVLSAAAVRAARDGRFVRTAGHVIVKQRPETAKGFFFLTLEDETGTSNAVLTPKQYRRFRIPLHRASIIEIAGPLQNVDDVVHVRVCELRSLAPSDALPPTRDHRRG